jgi:hypothetical protein
MKGFTDMPTPDPTDVAQLRPFFDMFRQETDRGCAVLGAVMLDNLLRNLLSKAFRSEAGKKPFQGTAPLATFSAKADMCFFMRLISSEDYHDISLVRKIRNDFAHSLEHSLRFDTPAIASRVKELILPKLLYGHPKVGVIVTPDSPRNRFEICVGSLTSVMNSHRLNAITTPNEPVNFSAMLGAE